MAVDIQCKDRRGVAQVFLHGLDVIPALDRSHGVAVAQIVETGLRAAPLFPLSTTCPNSSLGHGLGQALK